MDSHTSHPELLTVSSGPVTIKPLLPEHAPAVFAEASNPQVSEYLTWPTHASIDDSSKFITDCINLWNTDQAYCFGIFVENTLAGSIGMYTDAKGDRIGEVGTWLGTGWQGRGLNRYAKACMLHVAFHELGLHRIEMLVRTDNRRSLAATRSLPNVLEEGIQHDRLTQHGESHHAMMFAITYRTYNAQDWPPVTSIGVLHPSTVGAATTP